MALNKKEAVDLEKRLAALELRVASIQEQHEKLVSRLIQTGIAAGGVVAAVVVKAFRLG